MTSESNDAPVESAGEITSSRGDGLIGSESGSETEVSRDESLYPIDSKWFAVAFYSGVFAWIAWLLLQTRGWSFEDRFFPRMIGLILLVLLVIQLAKVLVPGLIDAVTPDLSEKDGAFEIDTDRSDRSRAERQKYELLMVGWVIALPLMLNFLGFLVTVPIYLFAFLLYFLRDVTRTVAISVVTTVAMYLLFVVGLNIQFP